MTFFNKIIVYYIIITFIMCISLNATITITSLPYTVTTSNETYILAGTSLSSTTNGIIIGNGIHDVIIDFDGDTLFFGTGGSQSLSGIQLGGSSYTNYAYNITIKDGFIIQNSPDTAVSNIHNNLRGRAIYLSSCHDVVIDNILFVVKGRNCRVMYGSGQTGIGGYALQYNIEIKNCISYDSLTSFTRRDYWDEQSTYAFEELNYTTPGMNYHYYIHNCSTAVNYWGGVYFNGCSSFVRVEDNYIYTDARNLLTADTLRTCSLAYYGTEDTIVGYACSNTRVGVIDSIRAWLRNSGGTYAWKAMIYDTLNNLLATSSTVLVSSAYGFQRKSFPFSPSLSVTSGRRYKLCIWAQAGGDTVGVMSNEGNTDSIFRQVLTYGVSPNPFVPNSDLKINGLRRASISAYGHTIGSPESTFIFGETSVLTAPMTTATECYALATRVSDVTALRNKEGIIARFIRNTIRSGNNYMGGRGIFIAGANGRNYNYIDSCIYVYGNNIIVHQGYDYYTTNLIGLLLRESWGHVIIDSNFVTCIGIDGNGVDTSYGRGPMSAFRLTTSTIGLADSAFCEGNLKVTRNTFDTYYEGNWTENIGTTSGTFGAALLLDDYRPEVQNVFFSNNIWKSASICIRWGFGNGDGGSVLLNNDTFSFHNDTGSYAMYLGYGATHYDSKNNIINNCWFKDGALVTDVLCSDAELDSMQVEIQYTISIYVVGNNALPVANAEVKIINNYNNQVAVGSTGIDGIYLYNLRTGWYVNSLYAGTDSVNYIPITVWAKKYNDSNYVSMSPSQSIRNDTVLLVNTPGPPTSYITTIKDLNIVR